MSTTATPSVAWLRWARAHGIDPDAGPTPTVPQQQAARERRIAALGHRIERAERAAGSDDDRISRDRAERRLEGLSRQRDALEQEQAEADDIAIEWRHRCISCDAPIARADSDYGAGRCARCQRGATS